MWSGCSSVRFRDGGGTFSTKMYAHYFDELERSFVRLTLFPYFSFFLVHTTSYIYGTAYDFMINYQVYHHLSQRTTLNRLSLIDSFLFSRTISIWWRSQFSNVIHDLVAKVCTIILSVWWIVIMIIAPSKRNVNKS